MPESKHGTASGYTPGEWGTKPRYSVECLTCGWKLEGSNAMGTAAQHARNHKHCVRVAIERVHIYNHEPTT